MRDILELHLKMQRRSHLEFWITVGGMVVLTVFFTTCVYIHSYIDELTDISSNESEQHGTLFHQRKSKLMQYNPPHHATLRQQFEEENRDALDPETIHQYLEQQRVPLPKPPIDMPYDIYNCPAHHPTRIP